MSHLSVRNLLGAVGAPLGWVAFFSCFLNISYLAAPLYMMQVYDRVLHSQSIPTLVYLTLIVALAYAVFSLLDAVRGQILASISYTVEKALTSHLIGNIVVAHEHDNDRPGSSQITRDLDIVRQFAAGSAVIAFIDLPWAPIYLGVLFMLNALLGVFATVICIVLISLSVVGERLTRGPMAQANTLACRSYSFGESMARSAPCVSTMGLGVGVTGRWKKLRVAMLSEQAKATDRTIILTAITRFVRLFTQSAILGLGAYLAINHQISGGAVFAGSLLLGRCLAPVEAVIANWRSTLAAQTAFYRIKDVSLPRVTEFTSLPAPKGELSLEQISWSPPNGERPALSGVTINLATGAVLAVVGPNAAGKSTLGRIVAGAMLPSEGIVRLDGAELRSWDPVQLSKAIGYLPQDPILFPGTIRENIARFAEVSDETVVAAAQAALAHDMIMRLPLGYQTPIEESSGNLSGGQRQRIALARALLFDPPVLVLDEPSASLDADGESALMTCVANAKERRHTVVIITHSSALVRLADYVATIVNGRVMRMQRPNEFFSRSVTAVGVA